MNYALRKQPDIKAIVATSPFLRLAFQPPKWKVTLGKLMLKLAPSVTLPSAIEESAISSIPAEVKRYHEDPLIHGKISPMYLFPVIDAGEYAIANAYKLKIPILVTHGTGDRIIDYKGSVDFTNQAHGAELKLYDNGYHELHHDVCAEEMLLTIVKWLDKH
ncbi:alpha/beta hydrolase [Lacinutrix neustonica]|uniref:Alpha/beta hydrolase n=1 Tax=Lacinutrix neustonica TaxID=2980107 RepID=A0A9E8N164_9FLAO|nr:alpha/beta hydrolase [Lacinutrix neustonica]